MVSNGTLAIASGIVPGELFVEGGKFAGGAPGEVVTNRIAGSITFNAGALGVTINKSLVASNTLYEPLGFVSVTSGSLEVANVGPALTVGEKFFVFNQPVANGSLLTVSGGGATWINNLETDGSITVNTVIPPAEPPTLNVSRTGNNLQFTWSGSGFKLQAQTNSLSIGITSNWADYPGGTASPVNAVVDPSQGTVFFRLVSTP